GRVFACGFTGLCSVADARCFSHFGFAPCCTDFRGFTAKNSPTVESTVKQSSPRARVGLSCGKNLLDRRTDSERSSLEYRLSVVSFIYGPNQRGNFFVLCVVQCRFA